MLAIIAAAACLIGSVLTQTPPSYTEAVADQSLGLTYGTETIKAGDTIGYKGTLSDPKYSLSPTPQATASH